MCADLVGGRAVKVRFRRVNIFLPVSVPALFVFRSRLRRRRSGFLNFLRTKTPLRLFCRRAHFLERCLQLLIVKRHQHLAGLNRVAFAHQNLVDPSAYFRANADVSRLNRARPLQPGIAVEPPQRVGRHRPYACHKQGY